MKKKIKLKREFLSTVYIVEKGKVLLTFNKTIKKFIPIGGHIDEDELPCEAVIREAKEESGFDIQLINPRRYGRKELIQNLDIGLDIIKPDHHHINISYIGKIIGGRQLKESDEGTELKWFSPEELIKCEETLGNIKGAGLKAIEIMKEIEKISHKT